MYRRICDLVVGRRGEASDLCVGSGCKFVPGAEWRLCGLVAIEGPFEMWLVLRGLWAVCWYHHWVCGLGHLLYTLQPLNCPRLILISVLSHQDPPQVTSESGPLLQADPSTHFSVSLLNNPLYQLLCIVSSCFSRARLCTLACQATLSMGFSRQEYWSGLPYPPPGYLPNPGIESRSPALQMNSLPSEPPGKPVSALKLSQTEAGHEPFTKPFQLSSQAV